MTQTLAIHRCSVCETVVEVLQQCGLELICCGRPMEEQAEQAYGRGHDTHFPMVERTATGIRVLVGPVPHEVTSVHYIQWIEVMADGKCHRQFLQPGEIPEATFDLLATRISVRVYCSVHGLWKSSAPILLPARQHADCIAV